MPVFTSGPRPHQAQIAALQARIVMAEAERDGYLATDRTKYLEAVARLEALMLELWNLRMQHLRTHAGRGF